MKVKVEIRESAAASFGKGRTQTMLFSTFLRCFSGGNDNLYMTAQVSVSCTCIQHRSNVSVGVACVGCKTLACNHFGKRRPCQKLVNES